MRKVYLGLTMLTLCACGLATHRSKNKKYFANLLKDVDKVQLKFFNHGDTLTETIADDYELAIYKELINGKRDAKLKVKCDSTGQILFFNKQSLVLNAYFSSPASGSKYTKPSVSYSEETDHFGAPLTYRSGVSIDDYYYKLRSTAIRLSATH
jgi:frataxin-like iron-binding protein CyaY